MTQEELDALMNSDLSETDDELKDKEEEKTSIEIDAKNYRVSADSAWPPPPPDNDHKVVHQLDEVTADSEKKAGEIFDILEDISASSADIETASVSLKEEVIATKEVFEKLSANFPHIVTFSAEIERSQRVLDSINTIEEKAQGVNDQIMMAMDVMQYQDIHRQKIERVINVMRALSRYMNQLFEGQIADEKRTTSAVHLHGDDTEDIVDEDDMEALIASFGRK